MNGPVKALSLWQPWASLIPLGVKRIETRGWSTKYRGWLLIHAAKKVARLNEAPDAWDVFPLAVYEATRSTENNTRFPAAMQSENPLPLGAVVGVARLVDCLPMTMYADLGDPECIVVHDDGALDHAIPEDTHINGPQLVPDGAHLIRDITEQRPYGDFTPGRYGWMLDDIRALPEPIPAKGRQGLWTPAPDLVASAFACVGLVD